MNMAQETRNVDYESMHTKIIEAARYGDLAA